MGMRATDWATLRFDSADARTLELSIVTYNIPTEVPDGPKSKPYRELFRPSAFLEQLNEAQSTPLRIWLDVEHRRGTDSVIGHAVRLLNLPGGLYGSFRVHDGIEGDEALGMVREGVLTGVSLSATPLQSRTVDGVTNRLRAHLTRVSLCRVPVYADAAVVGIRRGWREDQPGPASEVELHLWELERLQRKLRAVATGYSVEFCDQKQLGRRLVGLGIRATPPRSYIHDWRYQRVLQLQAQIAEQRAEIERRMPQPAGLEAAALAEAMRPKILRRALSGPIAIR
jgi:HK97 family phage prohead protease